MSDTDRMAGELVTQIRAFFRMAGKGLSAAEWAKLSEALMKASHVARAFADRAAEDEKSAQPCVKEGP